MTDPIRIIIVDDHPLVRQGLASLIATEPNMIVVGEAVDGFEAVDLIKKASCDIILMDLVMPRKDGLEAIAEIMKINPDARILVITSFAEDDKVFKAIKLGALGYLLKDSSPEELLEAIQQVHQGESSLHPTIARKLIREINRPPDDLPPTKDPLTPREIDVLKLVAQGLTNQEIADQLYISEWTVRTHVRNIMGKLHLANRTQAALYALREGLTSLSDLDNIGE